MSNLPGNPYESDAQDDPRNMGGTTANALLALAYEQRTANLIAYVEKIDDQTLIQERCTEIAHRLGLETRLEVGDTK